MLAGKISKEEYADRLGKGTQQGSVVQGGDGAAAASGAGAPIVEAAKEPSKPTMPEIRRKQHDYKLLLNKFEKESRV